MKESQNTEWKESWRDEYLKWLCGFANAEGGVLIIGRNDKGRWSKISNAIDEPEMGPRKLVLVKASLGVSNGISFAHFSLGTESQRCPSILRPTNATA